MSPSPHDTISPTIETRLDEPREMLDQDSSQLPAKKPEPSRKLSRKKMLII
ncbi:MAG: hypothetical protein ACTSYI_09540 [Promethearchaeota archaeon]